MIKNKAPLAANEIQWTINYNTNINSNYKRFLAPEEKNGSHRNYIDF